MGFSLLGLNCHFFFLAKGSLHHAWLHKPFCRASPFTVQGQPFYTTKPLTNWSQKIETQADKFGFHLLSAVTADRHTRLALHSPVLQFGIFHFYLQLCCMFMFAMSALLQGFASPFAGPYASPFARPSPFAGLLQHHAISRHT